MALPSIQQLRAEQARQQHRGHRWVRRLVWAGAGLVVLGLAIYLGAPPLVRSQLEKRLSAELNREVTVGRVKLNPCTLAVTIERFAIKARDGETLLGWERLYVNFDSFSLFTGEWRFQEIALDGLEGRLIVLRDGSLSVQDLVNKYSAPRTVAPAPAVPAKPARPLRIGALKVTRAQFGFTDHSRTEEFATRLGPVNFSLTNFVTRPGYQAPYAFTATTEAGETIDWKGTLSAIPLGSVGELTLGKIALKKYAPYYRDQLRCDLLGGTLSVTGRYEADLSGPQPVLRLHDGLVQLAGLQMAARGSSEPVLEVPELTVSGIEADTAGMAATVAKVALRGGRATVRRTAAGELELVNLLMPVPTTPAVAAPAAPTGQSALPAVRVKEVRVDSFALAWEDATTPRPVKLAVEKIDLTVRDYVLGATTALPLQFAAQLAGGGTIKIDGSVALDPVKAELTVAADRLALAPISPYLEPFARIRVAQGTASAQGQVQLALPAGQAPVLRYQGEAAVEQLVVLDGAALETLAGWQSLAVRGIDFSTTANSVGIAEIVWRQPTAQVILQADGTNNLAAVLAKPAAPAAPAGVTVAPAAPAPAAAPLQLKLDRFVLEDASCTLIDRGLTPAVQVAVQQFGGSIVGLSSDKSAPAKVDLRGKIDGYGVVTAAGTLYPFGRQAATDIKLTVQAMDLLPFSPYSGKYAGYQLARGKLALDVQVSLQDRKLDSSTLLTLDQFTFGRKTESPDATGLPVRLAVALLKDSKGQIVIDLPVQGSLDDPEFKISRVVWRVLSNVLVKAAASPFSLLGSMFGGGGEELSYCDFAPGRAVLTPEDEAKFATLQKALTNRPGLNLDLSGHYDAAVDTPALQQDRLEQILRRRIWESRRAGAPEQPLPGQLTVTPEERSTALRALYVEKYPAPVGPTPVSRPAAMAKAAPAPVKAGLLQRFLGFLARKSTTRPVVAPPPAPVASVAAAAGQVSEADMALRLAAGIEVKEEELQQLALERAKTVQAFFSRQGIAPERLFLAATDEAASEQKARVNLQLK